jgi:hypothetical protein
MGNEHKGRRWYDHPLKTRNFNNEKHKHKYKFNFTFTLTNAARQQYNYSSSSSTSLLRCPDLYSVFWQQHTFESFSNSPPINRSFFPLGWEYYLPSGLIFVHCDIEGGLWLPCCWLIYGRASIIWGYIYIYLYIQTVCS